MSRTSRRLSVSTGLSFSRPFRRPLREALRDINGIWLILKEPRCRRTVFAFHLHRARERSRRMGRRAWTLRRWPRNSVKALKRAARAERKAWKLPCIMDSSINMNFCESVFNYTVRESALLFFPFYLLPPSLSLQPPRPARSRPASLLCSGLMKTSQRFAGTACSRGSIRDREWEREGKRIHSSVAD